MLAHCRAVVIAGRVEHVYSTVLEYYKNFAKSDVFRIKFSSIREFTE